MTVQEKKSLCLYAMSNECSACKGHLCEYYVLLCEMYFTLFPSFPFTHILLEPN